MYGTAEPTKTRSKVVFTLNLLKVRQPVGKSIGPQKNYEPLKTRVRSQTNPSFTQVSRSRTPGTSKVVPSTVRSDPWSRRALNTQPEQLPGKSLPELHRGTSGDCVSRYFDLIFLPLSFPSSFASTRAVLLVTVSSLHQKRTGFPSVNSWRPSA